ncbi:hypothetical protein SBE55_24895, partial [Mycolicibacterium sp. 141076]|uniref:hypothetical protein n=1 Tax=Mycolicibacterium sp. 141076 TaxID=3090599 RepID=UPI00299DC9E0
DDADGSVTRPRRVVPGPSVRSLMLPLPSKRNKKYRFDTNCSISGREAFVHSFSGFGRRIKLRQRYFRGR